MEQHGSIEFSQIVREEVRGRGAVRVLAAFADASESEDRRFIEALVIHALERKV